jgi:hypothetical protein
MNQSIEFSVKFSDLSERKFSINRKSGHRVTTDAKGYLIFEIESQNEKQNIFVRINDNAKDEIIQQIEINGIFGFSIAQEELRELCRKTIAVIEK